MTIVSPTVCFSSSKSSRPRIIVGITSVQVAPLVDQGSYLYIERTADTMSKLHSRGQSVMQFSSRLGSMTAQSCHLWGRADPPPARLSRRMSTLGHFNTPCSCIFRRSSTSESRSTEIDSSSKPVNSSLGPIMKYPFCTFQRLVGNFRASVHLYRLWLWISA